MAGQRSQSFMGLIAMFISGLDPANYKQHALHDAARDWPQSNCYADLWIEALNALGHEPRALFGFTTAMDFEGDQFTFFKPALEDIERMYGLVVHELSLYDSLAGHVEEQMKRNRLVMVEVDAFYLPDTRGITYQLEHSKTTIGINRIDIANRSLDYFHNEGFFRLEGNDFDGAMRCTQAIVTAQPLPPYAEMVKVAGPALAGAALRRTARELLHHHLQRRPINNPIRAFAAAYEAQAQAATTRLPCFFHSYAFNTFRQIGANFELLASHLEWLDAVEFAAPIASARAISAATKTQQFQLARGLARKRTSGLAHGLEGMATDWDALFAALAPREAQRRAS